MTSHEEFMEILQVLMEEPVAKKKSPAPVRKSISTRADEKSTQTECKSPKGAAS
jgi:hypothetical protein